MLSDAGVARFFLSSSGTSLAETVIALAILSAGLLSLAQLFVVSGNVLRRTNDLSTAAVLAAAKVEELRTVVTGTGDTSDGVEFVDATGRAVPVGDGDAGFTVSYTRQWSIRPLPADADVRIVRVRVVPGRRDDALASATTPLAASEVALVTSYARDVP